MKPAVSVVLPVRNAEKTIGKAVESILQQDFRDFELLVVDDGSDDGSAACIGEYRDDRLKFVRNAGKQGVAEAMQFGVDHALAGWIARMDADDISHPSRLRRQLEWLDQHSACEAVSSKVRLINSQGEGMAQHVDWLNALETPDGRAVSRFIECPVAHPSSMIRADFLKSIGGYRRVAWAEDHDMWMRFFEAGGRMESVPEVLLDWRDSVRRLTRSDERYGDAARMRMRCHYLARIPRVAETGVVIAGAGPIGKSLSKGLRLNGIEVHGFFEVHPRRIGEMIHGVLVEGSDRMGDVWTDKVLLGAVGVPGGRERLRELALEKGRLEGEDFWLIC